MTPTRSCKRTEWDESDGGACLLDGRGNSGGGDGDLRDDGGDLEGDVAGDDVGAAAVEVLADVRGEGGGGGEENESAGAGAANLEGAVGASDGGAGDCLPWMSWTRAPGTAAPSGSVTVPRTMTAFAEDGDQDDNECREKADEVRDRMSGARMRA